MSKWFESGNLANYAKTALLQAQKRIDQVLDIKEEDIISGGQTPTSSSSAAQSQASSAATTINNLFSASLSKLGGGGGGETLTKSKLSSSSISSMTSKNKTAAGEEETESFFSAFLNSSSSNSTSTTTTAMNNSTSASQVANLSTFQPSGDDMEESNTASITSSTATIDEKINPPTTTKERKPKSTKMDLDKQNWIQNYVDKSVPNTDTKSDKKKEEKQRRSTSSSTTLVSAESTTTTTATTTTANPEIEEADIATKSVIIESSQLEENDSEKQLSPRGDLLTDECSSSTLILTARDQTSTSSMNNKSSSSQAQTSSMTDMDFVKIEGNASTSKENAQNGGSGGGSGNNAGGGSISGNASSNEEGEGLETCASSDIEVLSLPSTSGDQFLLHKSSGTIARVPSLASMAASSVKSGGGDGPKKSAKDNSEGSILKVNKSNSNVKQIFVKSPPPPPPPTVVATNNSSQNLQQQLQLQIASSAADGSSSSLPTPTVIQPGFDITTISPGDAASGTSTSAVNDIDPSIKNILDAREAHVLKLNRQNVSLQEENDNLMNEIEKLKYEFNDKFVLQKRVLTELQSKLDQSNSEREMLKRANAEIQRELADLKSNVSEKDSQIEQLTQEGLKLSKQELTQSNIIKKLRTKEKETEEVLNILKNDYQKSQKELDELKGVLDAKEEAETKNLDAFKKLEKTALALEKEMLNTKSLLEDSEEKVRSLESTLANSYKELSELRKSNVEKESRINETTSSIETQLREEVRTAVEKEKSAWAKKQEALRWEIESLRQDVTRVEQQHAIREDMLRKEIADLQQQLRDAEMRNNELSQNISSATKPLLRQIENLQASHSSQIELLENSERTLIQRLKETQANLCEASERSRQNQEQLLDLTQQCKLNEAQLTTLKLEKSKLISEYQLMKTTLENYENEKLEKEAQNRALITSLNQQIETLTREKKYLESQLEIVKTQAENDSKKFQALLTDVNREKEQQMQQMKQQQQQTQLQMSQSKDGMATPMSSQESPNLSRFSSFFEAKNELRSSFDFSSHPPSALNTLELLQSRLKQKEGEVIHLQKEVENLERVRESMARELVNLSDKLESYKEYEELQDKYDKLVIQHNALLTLLGEKTEENEELRMDLQDVKEMYKVQIEELLKNQRT